MFRYGYGFGGGFGYGRRFGYGFGRAYGFGNPTPYCRAYPWLPRGWWKWGYYPNGVEYTPYASYGYSKKDEVLAIHDVLKNISDTLTEIEKRLSELEK